ncbi:class I SAM-dependent methyltransferase [soil metagenome]
MKQLLYKMKRKFIKRYEPEKYESGHFYSVIPSKEYIRSKRDIIFSKKDELQGIDINKEEQVQVLKNFLSLAEEVPFYAEAKKIRFNVNNVTFTYDDAPILHYFMRTIKPKRIIEIGSGNSSAVMLDTDELYLEKSVKFTFIDIDCSNLKKNLKPEDYKNVTIIEKPVQEIDSELFKELEPNDLLFIDSSHVIKMGSDLHTIFFKFLPLLKPGVFIHFHDIRFPFEYSEELIDKKVFWNEAYLLRAFLQYNKDFKIYFWLNYLVNLNDKELDQYLNKLPLKDVLKVFNFGGDDISGAGGSIYITKVN